MESISNDRLPSAPLTQGIHLVALPMIERTAGAYRWCQLGRGSPNQGQAFFPLSVSHRRLSDVMIQLLLPPTYRQDGILVGKGRVRAAHDNVLSD